MVALQAEPSRVDAQTLLKELERRQAERRSGALGTAQLQQHVLLAEATLAKVAKAAERWTWPAARPLQWPPSPARSTSGLMPWRGSYGGYPSPAGEAASGASKPGTALLPNSPSGVHERPPPSFVAGAASPTKRSARTAVGPMSPSRGGLVGSSGGSGGARGFALSPKCSTPGWASRGLLQRNPEPSRGSQGGLGPASCRKELLAPGCSAAGGERPVTNANVAPKPSRSSVGGGRSSRPSCAPAEGAAPAVRVGGKNGRRLSSVPQCGLSPAGGAAGKDTAAVATAAEASAASRKGGGAGGGCGGNGAHGLATSGRLASERRVKLAGKGSVGSATTATPRDGDKESEHGGSTTTETTSSSTSED